MCHHIEFNKISASKMSCITHRDFCMTIISARTPQLNVWAQSEVKRAWVPILQGTPNACANVSSVDLVISMHHWQKYIQQRLMRPCNVSSVHESWTLYLQYFIFCGHCDCAVCWCWGMIRQSNMANGFLNNPSDDIQCVITLCFTSVTQPC